MKLICETCEQIVNSLAEWRDHLPSEVHQRNSDRRTITDVPATSAEEPSKSTLRVPAFVIWNPEMNKRAFVVTEFKHAVTDSTELLHHFSGFGLVADFICDSENHYAIVLYDDLGAVDRLNQSKWRNVIKTKLFRLRHKSQLSPIEWIVLIGMDGKYVKEDQHFFINHAELHRSIINQPIPEQLQNFTERTSLGPDSVTIRQTILRDVAYIIRQAFPKVYVYPLEPLVKGLQDNDEVFEMYMDPFSACGAAVTPPNIPDYQLHESQIAARRIVYIIQNQTIVPSFDKFCTEVTTVPEDALPDKNHPGEGIIRGIRFFHRGTGVRCKISFDAVMEANVSSLMSFFATLDVRVIPFFRFLRYWTRINRFSKRCPDVVPAITMLAIVYLVRKNIIPSVWALQQLARNVPTNDVTSLSTQHRPYFVEGWDVSFIKDISQVETYMMRRGKMPFVEESTPESKLHDLFNPNFILGPSGTRSLMTLLSEFFEAFAITDWNKYVISPFLGEIIPRDLFERGQEGALPTSLNLYKMRSVCARLDISQPLVIQHPFRLSHNVGGKLDATFVMELKKAFKETTEFIQKEVSSASPKILSFFPPTHTLLKKDVESEVEPECSDFDRSRNSEKASKSSVCPDSNPLTYSFVAKKATLVPSPGINSNRSTKLSSSSSRSGSTKDAQLSRKILKFELSKRFQEAFMNACIGFSTEGKLKDRLKTLAIVFMRDFVWSVWGRCFYLHTTSEKVPDTEERFHEINRLFMERFPTSQLEQSPEGSDSYMSDISDDTNWHNDLPEHAKGDAEDAEGEEDQWKDSDTEDDDLGIGDSILRKTSTNTKVPVKYGREAREPYYQLKWKQFIGSENKSLSSPRRRHVSDNEKADSLRVKLDKIPKSACKNYCQVMRLHGYQKIWSNRRGVRSALSLHEKLNKQLVLSKAIPGSSSASGGASVSAPLVNPLDKEEAITRAVLEGVTGWGKSPSKRAIWSLTVLIRIDTSKELPTLFMSIKAGRNPFVCQNMINYCGNHFPLLFSEYMMYRFRKWSEVTDSAQPSQSPPTRK